MQKVAAAASGSGGHDAMCHVPVPCMVHSLPSSIVVHVVVRGSCPEVPAIFLSSGAPQLTKMLVVGWADRGQSRRGGCAMISNSSQKACSSQPDVVDLLAGLWVDRNSGFGSTLVSPPRRCWRSRNFDCGAALHEKLQHPYIGPGENDAIIVVVESFAPKSSIRPQHQ